MTFEVVESLCEEPMRLIASPLVRFEPGGVAQINYNNDGLPLCDISNGNNAIGLISNSVYTEEINYNCFVNIWPQRMIFRTDNCEPGEYGTGDALYVSRNGLLTLEKYDKNSQIVGRVISGPKPDRPMFEALWL